MNVKIGRKVYDTEKSKLIAQKATGCYGDPTGFEERLYEKAKEDYFLFGQGGELSAYPQPGIVPVTVDQAREWLKDVLGEAAAEAALPSAVKSAGKKATLKPEAKSATKKPVKKA